MPLIAKQNNTYFQVKGPADKREEALRLLSRLGFKLVHNENDTSPWRALFPKVHGQEPGIYLAGGRHKEGLTQTRLAELTGIPQRHISEMENNKRTIGKNHAKLLAKVLKIDYRTLL